MILQQGADLREASEAIAWLRSLALTEAPCTAYQITKMVSKTDMKMDLWIGPATAFWRL